MSLSTAAVLYPVNSTTVDTGTGIDIRLLDSAEAGANDDTQTATATHTQDGVERTFDPATAGVTNTNNANTTLFKMGWALRLTEDMTPTDDTNCNAMLTSGTLTVNLSATINQSGGTYLTGSYTPEWKASLWRYDPTANTGTLIASGTGTGTPTWNYTPATGDLGTFKTVAISIAVPSNIEFLQGEILLLQVGLSTFTIPNPTLGTATWTYTLRVDNSSTNVTWAADQAIAAICGMVGSSSGAATALGVSSIVLPTVGVSAGIATVLGVLAADAVMIGTAAGIATVSGALGAVAGMIGTAAGTSLAEAALAAVVPTVGTVDIGGGGGGTTISPVFTINE
ncbi:MAG: hypothetical protein WC710_13625 [Gallionella sp.]|jgi:hypothetical protein